MALKVVRARTFPITALGRASGDNENGRNWRKKLRKSLRVLSLWGPPGIASPTGHHAIPTLTGISKTVTT
jgi:hypothetical protein